MLRLISAAGSHRALRALIAAALVTGVFFSTPLTGRNAGFDSDGVQYGAMAGAAMSDPAAGHLAPWCYRVLTPCLASLLPFQTLTNFRIVAFASNVASLMLLGEILGILCFSPALRIFGMLLYAGSFWTLKFSFYSPAYIDYQTQLLLLLVVYCTLRRSYAVLLLVLPVAAAQKEALAAYGLFSAIHIVKYHAKRPARARAALAFCVLAVPLATVFAVRAIVVAQNAHSPAAILGNFFHVLTPGFWPVMLQAAFSGMGMIPVVLVANIRPWLRFVRRHGEWAAYGLISLVYLFGGCDKARLFLYVLPLAVILALRVAAFAARSATPARFALWGAAIIACHFYVGGYFSPMGSFAEYLARMVPVHAGGGYVPYLLRNACLGLGLLAFTVRFMPGRGARPGNASGSAGQ